MPEEKIRPIIMKTTFMVTSMRSTVYIHNYEDLNNALTELFNALPKHYGLRIQIRGLNCLKDDHAKNIYHSFMKRQENKDDKEVGNQVAPLHIEGEKSQP